MIAAVELPAQLEEQLRGEARRAFPRECCGLIEGVLVDTTARAIALHATENRAAEPDRFEIDPAAHIALLRRLRGTERAIIGCYHSHPGGCAEPSERDRAGAAETDFLWLIFAMNTGAKDQARLAAFANTGNGFLPVEIHPTQGR